MISYNSRTSIFLIAIIIISSISMQFWTDHRLVIGEFPVSGPDILAILYAFRGITGWLWRMPRTQGRLGVLVGLWLLYNSIVGIAIGHEMGNPWYAVMQEYRIVLYGALAYFATIVTFRPALHLKLFMHGLIVAGVIVCVWQLVISLGGQSIQGDEITFFVGDKIARNLRDVNLPLFYAPAAAVLHGVSTIDAWKKGKSGLWLNWAFIIVLFFVPLLSMTRTIWVAVAMSLALLLVYGIVIAIRRGGIGAVISIAAMFCFLAGCLMIAAKTLMPSVFDAVRLTIEYSFSSSDTTFSDRLIAPQLVFNYLLAHYGRILFGMGFGNMWSGAILSGPFTLVHNTYLGYLVIGGILGLVLYVAIWYCQAVCYIRILARKCVPLVKVYAISALINMLVFSVLMMAMPPQWHQAIFLGTTLGIASVLAYNPRKGNHARRPKGTEPEEVAGHPDHADIYIGRRLIGSRIIMPAKE